MSDQNAEDNTAVTQIETIYAELGLATASDRSHYLFGTPPTASASFDVVISNSSQPFA